MAATTTAAAPAAPADRLWAVGYRMPSALRGLHVVSRVGSLRVAEVEAPDLRGLEHRPGIRFVHRVVARTSTDAAVPSLATPDWSRAATRVDEVTPDALHAAASLTIGIVDTGADLTAPSLAAKAPLAHNAVSRGARVDDPVGHGTAVAAIAAGSASAGGVAGFGGDARLMIVKASADGRVFTDVAEARAIVWAVDHGARIVNLSIAGSQSSPVERAAVKYAIRRGTLLVAAAGNTGLDGNPAVYPAALLGRAGLAVGAASPTGERAGFSTMGAYVDVLAPGVDVLGAVPALLAGATAPSGADRFAGSYALRSGTSFAAPEVAGAAALVWAANPTLTAEAVAATIAASASGGGVWTQDTAYGNLNVAAAVERARAGGTPRLLGQPREPNAVRAG